MSTQSSGKKIVFSYKWDESKKHVVECYNYLKNLNRYNIWIDVEHSKEEKPEEVFKALTTADIVVIFFNDDFANATSSKLERLFIDSGRKKYMLVKMQAGKGSEEATFLNRLVSEDFLYCDYFATKEPNREIERNLVFLLGETIPEHLSGMIWPIDSNKPTVFISYKWDKNQQLVRNYAEKLYSTGKCNVWLDVKCMYGRIEERMAEGIAGSEVVIIFYSQAYFESKNCSYELRTSQRENKPMILVSMAQGKSDSDVPGYFKPTMAANKCLEFFAKSESETDEEISAHLMKML